MADITLPGAEYRSIPLVYAFLRGESPDGIAESFPAISLEQVFGAVAFYLANCESIDAYLRDGRADFARMRDEARHKHPALYSKLEAARHGATTPSAVDRLGG